MADSNLLEDVRLEVKEPGDHYTLSHYVRKEDILRAQIEGVPCVALCGKEWVPNKDEEKYPVCGTCKEIYEGLTS